MTDPPSDRLTELLGAVRDGVVGADDRLFELVYDELLRMARGQFRRESPGHTLQPTALVNEAWIRLAGASGGFENQAEFYGSAARAMRRILVDHARRAQADKRGRGVEPVTLVDTDDEGHALAILEVEDALQALEAHDDRLAEVVRLRFFGGLTVEEIATVRGVSPSTIKRDWTYARAWLFARMDAAED